MTLLSGFPPVSDVNSKVLILGSMPGDASLRAEQYYAHPRNQFWPLLSHLFLPSEAMSLQARNYEDRIEFLKHQQIALWDVVKNCKRAGSLDSAIKDEIANDFSSFFDQRPNVRHVFFNGEKAAMSFRRLVVPALSQPLLQSLTFLRLPSTSPAHAGVSFNAKLAVWSAVKEALSS